MRNVARQCLLLLFCGLLGGLAPARAQDPVVLKALVQVVTGAHNNNKEVGVCGEMAGNPLAAVLLIGMGVNSLSMSAGSLLRIKRVIRSFSLARARQLLRTALRFEDPAAVRQLNCDF